MFLQVEKFCEYYEDDVFGGICHAEDYCGCPSEFCATCKAEYDIHGHRLIEMGEFVSHKMAAAYPSRLAAVEK